MLLLKILKTQNIHVLKKATELKHIHGNKSSKICTNKPLDMRLNSLAVEHAKKMQKDNIKDKHHLAILKTTRSSEVRCSDSNAPCSYNLCHKLKVKKSSSES